MDITVLEEKTINTQAMIRLFTELERKQPEGTIYAIVDNASYNHSKELKQFLRKHKRIALYYLPPYSPNLNPIERLWLFFHKKILYDRYYETFKEFKTATLDFFQNIKQYDKEHSVILTLLVGAVDAARIPDRTCRYTWRSEAPTSHCYWPRTTRLPSA
jgi:transposase